MFTHCAPFRQSLFDSLCACKIHMHSMFHILNLSNIYPTCAIFLKYNHTSLYSTLRSCIPCLHRRTLLCCLLYTAPSVCPCHSLAGVTFYSNPHFHHSTFFPLDVSLVNHVVSNPNPPNPPNPRMHHISPLSPLISFFPLQSLSPISFSVRIFPFPPRLIHSHALTPARAHKQSYPPPTFVDARIAQALYARRNSASCHRNASRPPLRVTLTAPYMGAFDRVST